MVYWGDCANCVLIRIVQVSCGANFRVSPELPAGCLEQENHTTRSFQVSVSALGVEALGVLGVNVICGPR